MSQLNTKIWWLELAIFVIIILSFMNIFGNSDGAVHSR